MRTTIRRAVARVRAFLRGVAIAIGVLLAIGAGLAGLWALFAFGLAVPVLTVALGVLLAWLVIVVVAALAGA